VRVQCIAAVIAGGLTLPLVVPVAARAEQGGPEVWNILPPGQSGTVNAVELARVLATDPVGRVAVEGRNAPPHFADQLERYDALNTVDPASLSEADLDTYYKRADVDVAPDEVARVERPTPGVTITWDRNGVPHVVGQTDADVAFGAGWAGTQDRMFLQDVLRHAGAAHAAEFLGPSAANIAMDVEQLRTAHYTEREANDQVAAAAGKHGAQGAELLAEVDAYLAGINAAQRALCPVGAGCPADYAALGRAPSPWTRGDLTYVASLVGGILGTGGGGEAANARWLQQLTQRFGPTEARAVYHDLRFRDASDAPTTASTRFGYGDASGVDPSRPGVALPDLVPGATAPGTGARLDAAVTPPVSDGRLDTPFGTVHLRAGTGMSNAALVSGRRTPDGHPIGVFGPQTGYFTPQLLTEISLSGPGIRARGVAFAGTNFLVQIGRGEGYAFSATSSGSDNVDTVVERLCDPSGAPATVDATHYLRDGRCVPMQRFEHTETALPTAAAPGVPQRLRFLVLRTHHGIVQQRTTVNGAPVAVVRQRSTYGREVDSIIGFARFNDPGFLTGPEAFARAASEIDYTFNWFYLDHADISFFSSGRLPLRASGVDPDLPRWGDARYDWRGWLPAADHPQQTNPPSGQLVNWNNKPAPGFAAADDQWGYGPVYRSQPLTDRVVRVSTLPGLVAAVQDAATVDTRAERVLPVLLNALGDVDAGTDPLLAEAVTLLRGWSAHREDRHRHGTYTDASAIALFDEWWAGGVGRDVLRGTLGPLADELPKALDDHPSRGVGSAFNGVAWYGYVVEDLSRKTSWHRRYCGGGDPMACTRQLRASLTGAAHRALAQQGVTTIAALTYDKSTDAIRPVTAGVVATRPIDWQNRPTFQQVVRFHSSLPHRVVSRSSGMYLAAARGHTVPATVPVHRTGAGNAPRPPRRWRSGWAGWSRGRRAS
jgi:acyl-homoserine lactone acylase PvdQ